MNDYQNPAIADLYNCVNDVKDITTLLPNNQEWGGASITTVLDYQATKANILAKINQLATTVQAGDQVTVWFSTHGDYSATTGDSFIAPVECDGLITSGLSSSELRLALDAVASRIGSGRIYLGVDACHAGTFTSDFSTSPYSSRYTVMTGSDIAHTSTDSPALQNGVFTYSAVHGIFADYGDTNGDGLLTSNELYQSIQDHITNYNQLLGNDTMLPQQYDGSNGTAVIASYDGKDILNGGDGSDRLDGGAGSDLLIGGSGDDTYIYGRNYGVDVIENFTDGESDGSDLVQFGAGITVSDLDIRQWGDDLLVLVNDSQFNSLKISNWFTDDIYKVDQFRFANGTVWSAEDMTTAAAGNSIVVTGNPDLVGGAGNDILAGTDGASHTMTGGDGNDVYWWDSASDVTIINSTNGTDMGYDILQIGIDLDDVTLSQSDYSLIFNTGSNSLTIQNWFIDSAF